MQSGSIENLKVWKKAIDVVPDVYKLLRHLPSEERYGLADQIRRSAISIPSNIAEGYGRGSDKELIHFWGIARGSLYELKTQIYLCDNLFTDITAQCNDIISKLTEVDKMLSSFLSHIRNTSSPHS